MLKPTAHNRNPVILFLTALFLFSGCKNFTTSVPFPGEENEFVQPLSRPFKFSEPKEIKWTTADPDSIQAPSVVKFNLDQLPPKPFEIGEPRPLLKPMTEQKFDWNSLPDTAFNFDNLPTQKLSFKTSFLGVPEIIKAGVPKYKTGASRGVMEAGLDMGLPGNGKCFVKDKYGRLWIGTDKGLCYYDGANFGVYGAAQGLKEENIVSLAEDHNEMIWAGTINGKIYNIDIKAGLLHQLADTFIHTNPSWGMMCDKEGQVWVNNVGSGIFIINTKKETIKRLSNKEGLSTNRVIKIAEDHTGKIWIPNGEQINIIDKNKGVLKKISKANGLPGSFTASVIEDKLNRIWLGNNNGAVIIDPQSGVIRYLSSEQGLRLDTTGLIATLFQDSKGKVWIGTNGEVYVFDEPSNTLEKINISKNRGEIIYSILEDKSGQVWMGSVITGCFFVNDKNGRPGNFTKEDGLADNSIWSVKEDKEGNIWIGSRNGINLYNPHNKTIRYIGKENGLISPVNTKLFIDSKQQVWSVNNNDPGISIINPKEKIIKKLGTKQGFPEVPFNSVLEDKKGQMWFGSRTGDIIVYDPEKKLVKKSMPIAGIKGNNIFHLSEDKQGQIWASCRGGGVLVLDPATDKIKQLTTKEGLLNNDLTAFTQDSEGNLWIGTQLGIDVADLKNNTLTSFTTKQGLPSDEAWTLDERNKKIYAGTTKGLSILSYTLKENGQSKIWKAVNYGKGQGLSFIDFAQHSSHIFKNGQLWAGVENQILTIIDELVTDTIAPVAYVTGVNILDKPRLFNDRKLVEDRVKNIDTLWNTELTTPFLKGQLPTDTSYLKKNKIRWDSIQGPYQLPVNLELPYNQNYLSFTFTGITLSNSEKVKYRYVLEGIDKNWSPVTDKNFSENYRDLPPGNYTFKVASFGMNGSWSTPGEFKFTITPPWWQTWWAYLLYFFLFISFVGAYIRYRSAALKRHNEELEEKVISRTNELRKSLNELRETQNQLIQSEKMASLGELTAGIAHEIQNPLNFVNNFAEISMELAEELKTEINKLEISNDKKEELENILTDLVQNQEKINFHGKRADAIVKGMLQHSRNSSGIKEPTDINALADEYLRLSYHGLRAKDKSFNAQMIKDFEPNLEKINVVSQDLGRVVLNLITNAFYAVTEKKKMNIPGYEPAVTVITKKINHSIEIRVKDNGMGVPQKVMDKIFQPFFTTKPVGQGTGLGLSLSYDIIKAHGGELRVETKEGEGAEFIIQLPV